MITLEKADKNNNRTGGRFCGTVREWQQIM